MTTAPSGGSGPGSNGPQLKEVHMVGPFILGKTLGSGSTGKVKVAFHKDTGLKVAIKIVNKELMALKPNARRKLEREIAIMKLVDHPNVLKFLDVYETSRHLFIITEYVDGGELFDYLVKKGFLEPAEALHFFQQIILGVEYCHHHLICHRDLKLENILLDSNRNVKIADFGMATQMKKGSLLETSCGSPHYASPEVVQGIKYDGMAADLWSCGVILYALLTGKLPFDDDNIRRLLDKVKSGQFSMPQYLHKDVRDLITRMLTVDPAKRITLPEIKAHPWFNFRPPPPSPPVCPLESYPSDPLQKDEIDAELVKSLRYLGWGATDDEISTSLLSPEKNMCTVFYRMLAKRKQAEGRLFDPEAVRAIRPARANPAVPRRLSLTLTSAIQSPRAQQPSNNTLSSSSSGQSSTAAPAATPSAVPDRRAAFLAATTSNNVFSKSAGNLGIVPVRKKKEPSETSFSPQPSGITVRTRPQLERRKSMGDQTQLLRRAETNDKSDTSRQPSSDSLSSVSKGGEKRIEKTPSKRFQIFSTSSNSSCELPPEPPSPKRSNWFSSIFTSHGDKNPSKILTCPGKSNLDVIKELSRVLTVLHCKHDIKKNSIKARYRPPECSSTVKLLIEVSTSKIGPGTVVSFTRKAGDVHAFRKLTERITADAAPALGLA